MKRIVSTIVTEEKHSYTYNNSATKNENNGGQNYNMDK